MPEVDTRLSINRLADALRTGFEWALKQDRAGEIADFSAAWSEIVAGGLADVRLLSPPMVDHNEPFLPFIETHVVKTDLFFVGGGGMLGGPNVDVLLQIWFDTEDVEDGFGVPLIMRKVPPAGSMPEAVWTELREAARKLTAHTTSGRLVLIADGGDFDWGPQSLIRYQPIVVINAHSFAGLRYPPRSTAGRLLHHFVDDLASGWIGDPALSGRGKSRLLDDFLRTFSVGTILRIRIERDS